MSKPFQERIFERIKESIGELMTEEELKKLVEASMHKAFFEKVEEVDRWGSKKVGDPLIVVELRKLMELQVKEALKIWMEEHKEEIGEMIDTLMREGLLNALVKEFNNTMNQSFWNFGNDIKTKLGLQINGTYNQY